MLLVLGCPYGTSCFRYLSPSKTKQTNKPKQTKPPPSTEYDKPRAAKKATEKSSVDNLSLLLPFPRIHMAEGENSLRQPFSDT